MQKRGSCALFCLLLSFAPSSALAQAQRLANPSFQLEYDAGGIRSLKRTGDVADTDYIAANGALGPILIRYRTAARGDWRELRQMLLASTPGDTNTIRYTLTLRHTCGNGRIDDGEQCDPNSTIDTCSGYCNAGTCTLPAGRGCTTDADCSQGTCITPDDPSECACTF